MNWSEIHIQRLQRFMELFNINRFKVISVNDKFIHAKVGWPDDGSVGYEEAEDVQDVLWHIQDIPGIDDALELGRYILENKLLSIDKILIDYEMLQSRINWHGKKFEPALNALLSIRVHMLDDGKETDSFFIHF